MSASMKPFLPTPTSEGFWSVSKDLLADELEFSLSRLECSGSLALKIVLSFLVSW
jgi:hypothetical protein